jgi:hypothetical protein
MLVLKACNYVAAQKTVDAVLDNILIFPLFGKVKENL